MSSGGTPEVQKEFVETLAADSTPKRPQDRQKRKPPIANGFALGYTYRDVLDTDHEGRPYHTLTKRHQAILLTSDRSTRSPVTIPPSGTFSRIRPSRETTPHSSSYTRIPGGDTPRLDRALAMGTATSRLDQISTERHLRAERRSARVSGDGHD